MRGGDERGVGREGRRERGEEKEGEKDNRGVEED